MKLYTTAPAGATLLQNAFIDRYMVHANGEFVKVYIYLLRCAGANMELTLSSVADVLEYTEKDLCRALSYWEKLGLLRLNHAPDGAILDISFIDITALPSQSSSGYAASHSSAGTYGTSQAAAGTYGTSQAVAGAHGMSQAAAGTYGTLQGTGQPSAARVFEQSSAYSSPQNTPSTAKRQTSGGDSDGQKQQDASRLNELKEQSDIRQLFFVAEQYLQRPLSSSEQEELLYYFDTLHFSVDLIEYLLEYCISKGSASRHYMRKVALAWAEAGITTVTRAREETNLYNRNYFSIMNAFGIKGRNPAAPELETMSHWINELGFSLDIILEACRRTIQQTHQPNFQYANKILERWKKQGVQSAADIVTLDQQRRAQQKEKEKEKSQQSAQKSGSGNRFNNFNQREYDYNQLERSLLNS